MPGSVISPLSAMVFFDTTPELDNTLADWLFMEGSLTQRFSRYCQQLSITPIRQTFINSQTADDDGLLPQEPRYWLREIVLYGDGTPWLLARTLIPESTLSGNEQQILHLGTTPLGNYLFTHPQLTRDFIQPGHSKQLWGRRSRLRLAGKPLLLTELFLSAAPAYHKELTCKGI